MGVGAGMTNLGSSSTIFFTRKGPVFLKVKMEKIIKKKKKVE